MIRRAYAETPLGQLHYREAGEGPAVVLLHQTASSSTMYERALPFLAERFRAIALDTPGFGLSDPPPSRPGSASYYGRAVLALLDALAIERAALVGFHTGATIAVEAAAQAPERASALALVGFLAVADDADEERWSWIIKPPYVADLEGRFLEGHFEILRLYCHEDDPEMLNGELAQRLTAGPDYWWAYEAVLKHRPYDLFPRLACPVLFVNPTGDMLIEETKAAHAALPGSSYAEMPGDAGAVMQHPREFADVIGGFLAPLVGADPAA